jgi:hypothetical protein
MSGELTSGESVCTVRRMRLVPRTRARSFGEPRRFEKPAAINTMRGMVGTIKFGYPNFTRF